tara:strand:+ start:4327 stop:4851 length:525 start_codon:yes stop_codon:yes gene_type:complete
LQENTDESLMSEVAKGDLDQLKILFERHHVHVFNFLYQMSRDRMLSEDMTQDVFYKVMKYRTTYHGGNFVSWLFTIARNGLKSHYTRKKGMETDLTKVAYVLSDHSYESKDDFTHLQCALNKLENSDRELLILNRFQEIKYEELAEIVGSTPGAVKTKVSRALKKLKLIYFQAI